MEHGGDIYTSPIEYDFSVNLNPLNCEKISRKIMEESLDLLGHYPDPLQRKFREAVASIEGVAADEVYGGSGASEILLALAAMIDPKKILLVNPSFAGYRHALSILGNRKVVEYSLQEDNGFSLDRIFLGVLEYEAQKGLELLILTNPNNPTGKLIPKDVLDKTFKICCENKVKVIVDECFIRMTEKGYSLTKYINKFDGLFVVNAFTKLFSIPGIRVGYVVSDKKNIARLSNYVPEWNMSTIAQTAGVICSQFLKESNWQEDGIKEIVKEREYLSRGLKELGFKVFDSDTVFLLLYSEENIYDYLKEKKILIRDCSNFKGLSKGFYRVAIKSHRENEILLEALKKRNE